MFVDPLPLPLEELSAPPFTPLFLGAAIEVENPRFLFKGLATPPLMPSVIVLDDDPDCLFFAQRCLKTANIDVIVTSSLSEANHHIYSAPPGTVGLFLLDARMPGCPPEVIIDTLKRRRPQSQPQMKIYFYSAMPESYLRQLAKSAGADGYLLKDDHRDLASRVRQILEGISPPKCQW